MSVPETPPETCRSGTIHRKRGVFSASPGSHTTAGTTLVTGPRPARRQPRFRLEMRRVPPSRWADPDVFISPETWCVPPFAWNKFTGGVDRRPPWPPGDTRPPRWNSGPWARRGSPDPHRRAGPVRVLGAGTDDGTRDRSGWTVSSPRGPATGDDRSESRTARPVRGSSDGLDGCTTAGRRRLLPHRCYRLGLWRPADG